MVSDYRNDKWVQVFESESLTAAVEAETIHALLESSGIESWILRDNVPELPTGRVRVCVLASFAEEAEALIRQAKPADEFNIEDQPAS